MKPTFFIIFLFLISMGFTQAQEVTDVNKHIDKLKVYEKVVEDGYGNSYVYAELANGYYFKSEYEKARKWFDLLFEADTKYLKNDQVKRRYQQTLKALGMEPMADPVAEARKKQLGFSVEPEDEGGN